jgi:hypothetical protein
VHRQKFKNIERDARVTLTIRNEQDPYHYAEVRGSVVEVVGGQRARDHIDELSQKYHGEDYDPDSTLCGGLRRQDTERQLQGDLRLR